MAQSTKSKLTKFIQDNPLETAARDTFGDIKDQFRHDFAEEAGKAFFEQLIRFGEKKSGDLAPGQELNLAKKNGHNEVDEQKRSPKKEKHIDIAPGIDYRNEILHAGERLSNAENRELHQRIQELMEELKRLVDSSALLKIKFAEATTEQAPVTPGKYHLHFFQWMITVIRDARIKVEDSGAWLQTVSTKKQMRKYGAMAKKHGTQFTLSGERTPATQTG